MFVSDHLTLDAPRRTNDGYLAVRARAARTGVYQYAGRDVDPDNKHGLRDRQSVNVLRDADEVFSERAVHSFLMKPITDNHPAESVTALNWRDHARGTVAKAMRDGDHLAFDLILMDASAIAAVDAGKRELSNGYSCDLQFGDFAAPDGTKCEARQTNITGNHVALVDRGRAGATCRIGDAAPCDALPATLFDRQEPAMKTMLIDGLTVDISNADTAQATIQTLLSARDGAHGKVSALQTEVADKDRELAAKDTEIADLKAKVADEATLDARAAAKADVVAKGKTILGDRMPDVKGKSLADTRRAIVVAAVNDAALKDKSDDYIEARFDGLKDAKGADPLTRVLADGVVSMSDARTERDRKVAEGQQRRADMWKGSK